MIMNLLRHGFEEIIW